MLVLSVGEPPQTFTWRYAEKDGKPTAPETLTPQQFYKEKIGIDLSQYVCLMNHPMHPYGKHYVFARSRNMIDGKDQHFLNVEIDEMKEFAVKSICDEPAGLVRLRRGPRPGPRHHGPRPARLPVAFRRQPHARQGRRHADARQHFEPRDGLRGRRSEGRQAA